MHILVKQFLISGLKKHKYKILGCFIVSVIAGLLEMTGIGLVFPFIYLLVSPDSIQIFPMLASVKKMFQLDMKNISLILLCSITLILFLKNLYMLTFHYFQMKIVSKAKSEFSARLMRLYLYLDYNHLLKKDTSEVIRNIALAPVVFDHFILSIFNIFVASILAMGVLILLFSVLTLETIFATMILGSVLFFSHKKLKKVYTNIGSEADEIYKERQGVLSGSMAGLRETKIVAREDFFLKNFLDVETRNYKNQQFYNYVSTIPVLIIECCIIGSILSLILFYLYYHKQAHALAVLSLLVASMFRALPLINKVLTALQLMNRSKTMLQTIVEEITAFESTLYVPSPENKESLSVKNTIFLNKVSFTYPRKDRKVISNISLKIEKGKFVAIFGKSGSGKSTLLDMLLGLIEPDEGEITIDKENLKDPLVKTHWKRNIAYVPQNIYLANDTILSNIAYGIEKSKIIDENITEAIKLAQLDEVINNLPNGVNENLGENGLKLSTGQRQRIGIARAFYNTNAEFIAFDEATANLDAITESKIIDTLLHFKGEKTIVIISHNANLLKECDMIYVMDEGEIKEFGNYEELIQYGQFFRQFFNITSKIETRNIKATMA